MAEKKISLRKPPAAAPVAPLPPTITVPGISGQLPLPSGMPLRANRLTPLERRELQAIGWKEGDPIPSNVPELLAEARAISEESMRDPPPPVPLNTPVTQPPTEVRLEDLPPDKRQAFAEALRSARNAAAAEEQRRATSIAGAGPGVNEAIQVAATASQTPGQPGTGQASQGPSSPEYPALQGPPDAGVGAAATVCAQCQFPTNVTDVVEVQEEDKVRFIESVLAGRPFQKEYPLLGGKLVIRLRTLTPEELDVAWAQVNEERKRGEHLELADRWEQLNRYREALQIVRLVAGDTVKSFPGSYAEWKEDAGDEVELLPLIKNTVWHEVITTESIRRMLSNVVMQFNRLTIRLEANAYRPDFWTGIESDG